MPGADVGKECVDSTDVHNTCGLNRRPPFLFGWAGCYIEKEIGMVTKEQFKNGVLRYVDNEIANKVGGVRKWLVIIASTEMTANMDSLLSKLPKNGYVQNDGMIDIDRLYTDMHRIAEQTGPVTEHIPVIGDVTFNTSDIESLYRYIVS